MDEFNLLLDKLLYKRLIIRNINNSKKYLAPKIDELNFIEKPVIFSKEKFEDCLINDHTFLEINALNLNEYNSENIKI